MWKQVGEIFNHRVILSFVWDCGSRWCSETIYEFSGGCHYGGVLFCMHVVKLQKIFFQGTSKKEQRGRCRTKPPKGYVRRGHHRCTSPIYGKDLNKCYSRVRRHIVKLPKRTTKRRSARRSVSKRYLYLYKRSCDWVVRMLATGPKGPGSKDSLCAGILKKLSFFTQQ